MAVVLLEMIRASINMIVDPQRRNEVVAALRSMLGPTRAEPGCLECSLYCDAEDKARLCLIEEWLTQADLRRRLRSKEYRNVLEVMEMATVLPQVQFDAVSTRRGIELIHEAREAAS